MIYRLKKRLVHFLILGLLFVILFFTLLPILWMIYASFKTNSDILGGRMGLTRLSNDVSYLAVDNHDLYVCTTVGNITKYDRAKNQEVFRHDLGTGATFYSFKDKDYIWISSSNRGLLKIRKDNLEFVDAYPFPIKDIEVSKVGATVQYFFKDKIWIGMQWDNSPGLLEFDLKSGHFGRVLSLGVLPNQRQIIDIAQLNDNLFLATNTDFMEVDPNSGQVVRTYPWINSSINGSVNKILFDDGKLLLATSAGLYEINLSSQKAAKIYPSDDSFEQIYLLQPQGGELYIGSNNGLTIFNPLSKECRNYPVLFTPLRRLKQEGLTQASVLSLAAGDNGLLYLGSSDGRITVFDPKIGKVKETFFVREARVAIATQNYVDMWKNINFGLYLRNSFIICGITMLIAMVLATMSAYALSRFPFPGAKFMGTAVLATQMVPGIMFLIPLYLMFVKFTALTGIPIKGTFGGLIFLYSAFFVPFSIWILRGFFASIPVELEEAARIDGCSPFQVFWKIALPENPKI